MINNFVIPNIQVNCAVKELDLSYNGFADKGMIALADTLKMNNVLSELDVRLMLLATTFRCR